jgi:hypothetical protein
MLTGIAMSPAVDNRFPFFPKLFGSRQGAAIHPFYFADWLPMLSGGACGGRRHWSCQKHEPHRNGARRRAPHLEHPRDCVDWRSLAERRQN